MTEDKIKWAYQITHRIDEDSILKVRVKTDGGIVIIEDWYDGADLDIISIPAKIVGILEEALRKSKELQEK